MTPPTLAVHHRVSQSPELYQPQCAGIRDSGLNPISLVIGYQAAGTVPPTLLARADEVIK